MDGARTPEMTGLGHLSWRGEYAPAAERGQRVWPLGFRVQTLFKPVLIGDRIGHESQGRP